MPQVKSKIVPFQDQKRDLYKLVGTWYLVQVVLFSKHFASGGLTNQICSWIIVTFDLCDER